MGKITKKQMEIIKRILNIFWTVISTVIFKNKVVKK